MTKKYTIVQWQDETVSAVLSSWLRKTNKGRTYALWPPSGVNAEDALKYAFESNDTWGKHTIVRVFVQCNTYKRAQQLSREALTHSNFEDSSDAGPEPPSKRHQVVVESQAKKSKASKSSVSPRSDLHDIPERSTMSMGPPTTPASAMSPRAGLPTTPVVSTTQSCGTCQKVLDKIGLQNTEIARLNVKQDEMIKTMLETTAALTELRQCIVFTKPPEVAEALQQFREVFGDCLPLATVEALSDFDELLECQKNYSLVIQYLLRTCGGKNMKEFISDGMKKLIENSVAVQYSGQGRRGTKKNFSALRLYKAIVCATLERFPGNGDKEVLANVGHFLIGARDRGDARKARSKNAEQAAIPAENEF